MLNWLKRFSTFCFLDNNQYQIAPHTQECLVGAGIQRAISSANAGNDLSKLQEFIDRKAAWLFGHLNYELMNEKATPVAIPDKIAFPDFFFFQPEVLIRFSEKEMKIEATDPESIFADINAARSNYKRQHDSKPVNIQGRLQKEEYLETIEKLRAHILRGDCYEINFCQEFFAEHSTIDPFMVYRHLIELSPNPFSGLYRLEDKWLICASPERFIKKEGTHIISQPIKGTTRRLPDEAKDEEIKNLLYESEKDRSENVMVVDLVRNDLSRICKEGSVKVDELYGIYTFPQLHQMISTVSGELESSISFKDILQACFPMGSMTGAPKKRVMELIKQYEYSKRGIFSGALGYIAPTTDFDFNVVIRSVMYNESEQYLSFQAGSGITFYSSAENEWDECLLKAKAIRQVLSYL